MNTTGTDLANRARVTGYFPNVYLPAPPAISSFPLRCAYVENDYPAYAATGASPAVTSALSPSTRSFDSRCCYDIPRFSRTKPCKIFGHVWRKKLMNEFRYVT